MSRRIGQSHAMLLLAVSACCGVAVAVELPKVIETQNDKAVTTAKPVEPAAEPSTVDRIKQPVSWFKWGADFRWRQEFLNNARTLDNTTDNESDYQRYRARAWFSLLPGENFAFNNRWTWEGRYYWQPDSKEGFQQDYIIADQLNVQIKNIGGDAKNIVTLGRQDIALHDGWLIMDGTPLDGSKTLFLDGVRGQFNFPDAKGSLDAAVFAQRAYADTWSPMVMAKNNATLTEQDEFGAYVDYGCKPDKVSSYDAYFIYKNNDKKLANGDQGEIYALGARAEHGFTNNVTGRVEGAYEFGRNNNSYTPSNGDLQAWGANSRLTYAFKDQSDNKLHMVGEFLSGDKPGTQTNEQFDVLWGRWPRFSELYAITQSSETRAGDYSNLYRLGPTWEVNPTQKLSFSTSYFALFADQRTYPNSVNFGDGYFRGQLFQAIMRYKFNRFLTGHLWGEYFIPGNYYSDARQDNAVFLRAELAFAF